MGRLYSTREVGHKDKRGYKGSRYTLLYSTHSRLIQHSPQAPREAFAVSLLYMQNMYLHRPDDRHGDRTTGMAQGEDKA